MAISTTDPKVVALFEQYGNIIGYEDLRMYFSSVSLLRNATGGWGEITLDFKGGETTDARILLTQKRKKEESKK